MERSSKSLVPSLTRVLEQVGQNLKLARLRRRYAAETVAQRAGMARATLYRVEQGDPSVSLGNYARVMQVLRLEEDLKRLGLNEELGRKLQDAALGIRVRAPKRKKSSIVETDVSR